MKRRGRPILGAISGLLFGVFLAVTLILKGVILIDSPVIAVVPAVGLVLGIILGVAAPFRRGKSPSPPPPSP